MGIQRQVANWLGVDTSTRGWPPARLSVGLQGGGSFGAFAWGVLDRLLEEETLAFDALSGASAGAVNAVLLASGLLEGGRLEGKARLERFWRRMSASSVLGRRSAFAMTPLGAAMRILSPYQFNPFNFNPLRDALVEEVDFARLRAEAPVKLLIAATRVSDGRQRIFRENELTADMVLASTCLPLLHHTVNIDGEDYWDGGYVANPPLFPLALASGTAHILAVLVTPNAVERTPLNRRDIVKRLEQIQFNATVNAEFAALQLGAILRMSPIFERLRLTSISAADEIAGLARESAGNLGWNFLDRLRQSGRDAASVWLARQPGST
jgi:NTE family protein